MPRSYKFNVSFDSRVVLTDEDVKAAAKYRDECRGSASAFERAMYETTRIGTLDDFIAATIRAALRKTLAELVEEDDFMTASPAKVTRLDTYRPAKECDHTRPDCACF